MRNHKPHVSQKAAWIVLAIIIAVSVISAVSNYIRTAYGVDLHI